ncbi:MAG: transglutaminase domain-containing protein [Candidatus Marinimicrobia bacterium]|nr:transglutaminase domain-containing protein [Candidatus Neomarinimicrobiota bacterium]
MMNKRFIILLFGVLGVLNMCTSSHVPKVGTSDVNQINILIDRGEYTAASKAIQEQLQRKDLSPSERDDYLFEIERMDRIRKDFTARYDDVYAFIQKYYRVVTESDMEEWENSKALEVMLIDGEKLYFEHAARNLFRIDSTMEQIWNDQHPEEADKVGSGARMDMDIHNAQIIQSAVTTQKIYVEPKRLRIRQSIEVKPNEVPAGKLVRCWIPYPRQIEGRQEDITLIRSTPMQHVIAPEKALQRTIYMESPALADQPLTFTVEYEMTTHGVFHNIDAEAVTALDPTKNLGQYLGENPPHIVFTPELIDLSQRIVGEEKNPYRIAQKLFAWVDNNTPWASAREYSTIKCIPEYAFENGHGDCGIQTLLFMTLCRINGIPTRWQSGWELQPPHDSMHDWGNIYFEPYGWVPMDVTYGLRKSDDQQLHWFYLGGMDSYRIIFNDDYGQTFIPEKSHFRSETVDSQRGEVEWSGGNLYFDQWRWKFAWEILD